MFANKVLLITGGTSSFGNAVLKRFLDADIAEIRIFMALSNLDAAVSSYTTIQYGARLMKIIEAMQLRTKTSRRSVNW